MKLGTHFMFKLYCLVFNIRKLWISTKNLQHMKKTRQFMANAKIHGKH